MLPKDKAFVIFAFVVILFVSMIDVYRGHWGWVAFDTLFLLYFVRQLDRR